MKWEKINKLKRLIEEDGTLSNYTGNLECVCYAPNLGYRSWIFKFEGVLVALFDEGNGHYDFHRAVSFVDILVAKLMLVGNHIAFRRINK